MNDFIRTALLMANHALLDEQSACRIVVQSELYLAGDDSARWDAIVCRYACQAQFAIYGAPIPNRLAPRGES